MARFGNTGASSLLSAAQAAFTRQQSYNDSLQGYQFDLSAKTPEDFKAYQDYLSGRLKTTSDPTKQLTLQKTLTSASRSFNSAEISRASTAVKYGDISNRDKLAELENLYQRAIGVGDYNLAQSIESQHASLTVTIQNEDIAAQNAATAGNAKAQANAVKSVNEYNRQLDTAKSGVEEALRTGQPLTYQDPNFPNDPSKKVTTYVTNVNHDALTGLFSLAKYQSLQAGIDAGLDTSGTMQQAKAAIEASPEYIRASQGRNGQLAANGVTPKAIQYDNGVAKIVDQPVDKNTVIGHDSNGQPIFQPLSDMQGKDFYINRQIGTGKDATTGAQTLASVKIPESDMFTDKATGLQAYYDPKTGKKVILQKGTTKNAAGDDVTTRDLADAAGQPALTETPHGLNRQAFANTFNGIGDAIGGTFNRAVGGILNHMYGNQDRAQNAVKLKAMADAKAAATNAALQAAARQSLVNLPAVRAATPAPVRSYVPTAPKSQLYLPTPIAQSPAQVFNAALPANSNDSQKAAALGKAVGYNF